MKNQSDSSESSGSEIRSYIEARVRMLFAVFNRRDSDELIEVFKNRLEKFSDKVLRKVFDKCESDMEKFPTVRRVLEMCYAEKPAETWRYNFQPSTDHDGNPCLLDPDPNCSDCKEPRSRHPHSKCQEFTNRNDNEFLYRPQHRPEGREFLAALRGMAIKKLPQVDYETSRANLQAQSIAITKHMGHEREPGDET